MTEPEPKITRLPDDWRLSASATRKRALFGSLSPSEQKVAAKIERKKKYAHRKKKKRGRGKGSSPSGSPS